MEEEIKKVSRKRLTPESTILLTIGGFALAVVVYRVIYFIITGA